jgi:hypothetical protein
MQVAALVSAGILFALAPSDARAQRVRNANPQATPPADAPTVTGRVVAFVPDKSIALETASAGETKRTEFRIVKDRTRIELPPRIKEIALGITLSVWADKEDAALAARIGRAASARPQRGRNPSADIPRAPRPPAEVRPPRLPVAGLAPQFVAEQIDRIIQQRLAEEKIPASPPADDAEFIRRVYLDIAGVIPPAEKVPAFLGSSEPDKRARLIDELLASPDYGWHFADLWCDRIDLKDLPIYREPFIDWLSAGLNAGRGWDEIVLDLLMAEGSFNFITRGRRLGSSEPQALFLLLNTEEGPGKGPNPAWLAGESGRLFLGVQLQCAECHDHPFTATWKQTDFWGLAAFFSGLRAERPMQAQGLQWVEAPASGPVSIVIPATALKNVGTKVPARLLGAAADYQPGDAELLRHSLARWMTAADNPYFAKATANRLWAHFFGRGLVNPVDDIRPDNPCSHPEILQLLAGEAARSQFDLKHLIRCLCLTAAYQRTSEPLADNVSDQTCYSHQAIKTLGPGVFYDSLKMATGWPELKLGLPERKTKLTVLTQFTPREVFVDFFRAAQGEEANPLDNDHGIPQALKLMNAAQLSRPSPVVQRVAAAGHSREQAIQQLYLAALGRRPTTAEAALMSEFLAQRSHASAEQGYSAVLWVLINSAEFVSNH